MFQFYDTASNDYSGETVSGDSEVHVLEQILAASGCLMFAALTE